ncbi:hypothetical protein AXF42_Ash010452 [Apostasia shenzhenica]|uniref:FAD dependent oxidoreductase domain-containing protein n=1 Tax=Apostasia shenzhenica TaxID=1088818 RepID=A0A2I0BE12_9ASPA|nr:hypothetical protein AXF42_Ash010452 [Apostasia shenzhenica]
MPSLSWCCGPFRHSIAAMATKPSAAPSPSGAGDEARRIRVVVCGGGVIGACTAYFLATKGAGRVSVTVVEKSAIACAASGKAGGFLALDWCDGTPLEDLARASFRLHRYLSDLLDGSQTYGYRSLTTLSLPVVAASGAGRSGSSALPAWIDGAAAARPRTIGTPETTAQVHPQLFTRTLLSAAVANHGVKVIIGDVHSVEIATKKGYAADVGLRDGTVQPADAVVLALGPWTSRLPLVSSIFNISGLKAHSIVLRPPESAAITAHALFLSYQPAPGAKAMDPEVFPRPTGNLPVIFLKSPIPETLMMESFEIGEVYICGLSKEATPPDDPEEIAGESDSIAMLHKIAGAVSSHLKTGAAELVAEQACFLPCTDDGQPVIGEIPGAKNCYVAAGHSCWGILNGPATGAALAELILDGRSTTVSLEPFSPARFLRRRGFS